MYKGWGIGDAGGGLMTGDWLAVMLHVLCRASICVDGDDVLIPKGILRAVLLV